MSKEKYSTSRCELTHTATFDLEQLAKQGIRVELEGLELRFIYDGLPIDPRDLYEAYSNTFPALSPEKVERRVERIVEKELDKMLFAAIGKASVHCPQARWRI